MDALTLDQIRVFVAAADRGDFSAAARQLRRTQSSVTYSIRKLEDQLGVVLFDRTPYRPVLTEAAQALLPRARRIVDEAAGFRAQARGIATGLEPELTLAVEPIFPMAALLEAMHATRTAFPELRTRVYAESLGGGIRLLQQGACTIALVVAYVVPEAGFMRVPLRRIALVMVAAPEHPLARHPGRLEAADLQRHVQLVITDRSGLTGNRDHGVFADQTWRLGDLGTKHAMLRAGFGFGSMPEHLVADDLQTGRLVRIHPQDWNGVAQPPELPICATWRRDAAPGPAGRLLIQRLADAAPLAAPG